MRFGRAAGPKRSTGRSRAPRGWRNRILAIGAAVLALPVAAGIAAPTALASPAAPVKRGAFEELMVPSSMGPIKVQVQWAARGGNAGLYLLDGLRARDDRNAWSFETNALQQFGNDNISLIMPVGGQSSFYADWYSPSNTNGQKFTYKWETFLTRELPAFLEGHGVSRTNNAIAGLSMGGSAALALAAYHRDQFRSAAAYSGYLNISAPGMREAIRVAMIDAGGYNVDSMAAPWDPKWLRIDPFVAAPRLVANNTRLWVSAASGLPTATDGPSVGTVNGMGLEALALVNTRAFQIRMATLGAQNVHYDFPAYGIHAWNNWADQALRMLPDLSANIG